MSFNSLIFDSFFNCSTSKIEYFDGFIHKTHMKYVKVLRSYDQ